MYSEQPVTASSPPASEQGAALTVEQLRDLVDRMPVGILTTDADNRIVTANPAAAAIAGIPAITRGADVSELIHPDDLAPLGHLILEHIETGKDFHVEFRVQRPDGSVRWVRNDAHVDRDADGRFNGLTGTWLDITNLRAADELLRSQATEDQLTGLGNRRLLFEVLEEAVSNCVSGGPPLTLLFIDLDGFKAVNDISGHSTGDVVLAQVADRIRSAIRQDDFAARFGGDEFIVLCRHDGPNRVSGPEDVAQRLIDRLSEPFEAVGRQFQMGASIGIAEWRPDFTPDEMVKAADRAVYEVKRTGRGRWRRGN